MESSPQEKEVKFSIYREETEWQISAYIREQNKTEYRRVGTAMAHAL